MQVAAVHFDFVAFDQQICIHRNWLQIFDAKFGGDGAHATEAADFAHHFIEHRGDDAAVDEPDAALVFRAEAEGPRILFAASSCSNVSCMPRAFAPPQPKQMFSGLGLSNIVSIAGTSMADWNPPLQFQTETKAARCVPKCAGPTAATNHCRKADPSLRSG